MKKYTLLALIGACLFVICQIINFVISATGYYNLYVVTGILYLIGWALLALFFFQLYQHQK